MKDRQFVTPVLVRDGEATPLRQVPFDERTFDELALQDLLFAHPALIPVGDVEPLFAGLRPLARELPVGGGFLDLIFMNGEGYLTLVETKLWRNPEARRTVVAQIIDYASHLSTWTYDALRQAVLSCRHNDAGTSSDPLVDLAGVGAQLSRPVPERPVGDSPRIRPAAHNQVMKSRVHPKHKTKYHVRNWASYERALVERGDVTVWLSPDAIAAWKPEAGGRRGGQRKYSDLAIETGLTLRLLFHLPLRQAEGFLTSLFRLMGLNLRVPDHTTLSRRGQHLDVNLHHPPRAERLHLLIDSTGLSTFGEGEWAAAKHGGHGTRGWRKLHLGVHRSGVIVAEALTDATTDDALTGITLVGAVEGNVASVTADPAYDTIAFYDAATEHGAQVVVPPAKTARLSQRRPRSRARDRTIRRITKMGRRRWKKEAGYHRQARVENAFFRYKSILGDRLRGRTRAAQEVESVLACNVLNRMTELGRPESFVISR